MRQVDLAVSQWRVRGRRTDLVEIEDDVELADVAEELVEELHEEVDRLEVRQLVVRHVHAHGEVQPRVAPVDELVALVLRVGWGGAGRSIGSDRIEG